MTAPSDEPQFAALHAQCKTCSVEGCDGVVRARGWCNKHWQTWYRNGDPLKLLYRPDGTGHIRPDGYHLRTENGVTKREHVRIAERALGHALPAGAQVHHVDEDTLNNTPTNLVICPDAAYHKLLHKRQRAFDASGHYEWRKCTYCKQYDDPENLRFYGKSDRRAEHRECSNSHRRQAYALGAEK